MDTSVCGVETVDIVVVVVVRPRGGGAECWAGEGGE